MTDVNNDGSCDSPEHPGQKQVARNGKMHTVLFEGTNLPVGSYTTWADCCQRWVETLVEGPEVV